MRPSPVINKSASLIFPQIQPMKRSSQTRNQLTTCQTNSTTKPTCRTSTRDFQIDPRGPLDVLSQALCLLIQLLDRSWDAFADQKPAQIRDCQNRDSLHRLMQIGQFVQAGFNWLSARDSLQQRIVSIRSFLWMVVPSASKKPTPHQKCRYRQGSGKFFTPCLQAAKTIFGLNQKKSYCGWSRH